MKHVALIAILALATPAAAEINEADSIEWQTIDSAVVVRGVVTGATARTGEGSVVWYDVVVHVTETIKGHAEQTLHVGVRGVATSPDRWRENDADLLLFLVPGRSLVALDKDFARYPWALRYSQSSTENPLVLGTSPAYTADFRALTKADDVLATVRAAARSTATKSQRVDVPWETTAMKALYRGSVVWMTLPVDAALEQLAIRWLADRTTREQGVTALANFKSDANIERMKLLLADPDFAEVTETGKPKLKRYLVRQAADAALASWNVPHATPVLTEPAER